jgi:ketosteroid isomerase-like protein
MSAEEDIRRTMGRYIQGHDTHNVEAILAEFADDGEFINPAGTFTGKARVREFFEGSRANAPAGRKGKLMCANSIIEVEGDSAKALTDVVGFRKEGDAPWAPYLVAQYADTFAKRGDKWVYLQKVVVS